MLVMFGMVLLRMVRAMSCSTTLLLVAMLLVRNLSTWLQLMHQRMSTRTS